MLTQDQIEAVAGYDLIGDVHGCAMTLERLLARMGYSPIDGCWSHPERLAVFVGDIIDRGPNIREALMLVKRMTEEGKALCIMGNHEYNAITFSTPCPEEDDYLRAHNTRHTRLIAETLEQYADYQDEWQDCVEWMKSLPLFLETEHFRVVHACWDQILIDELRQRSPAGLIDMDFIYRSTDHDTIEARIIDRLTRGTGLLLPEDHVINGRDGFNRRHFRTKFWAASPKTYGDVVFQPDPLPDHLHGRKLERDEHERLLYYPDKQKPLFFGHYWLQGEPQPLRHNIACLDYSAVKYGRLVAYRYDREEHLRSDKFMWESVELEEID